MPMLARYNKRPKLLLFSTETIVKITSGAALALALTACGGGGGGDVAATPGKVTTSGVAAIGAPVADGQVEFKCASGARSSATTAADGSFSVELLESDYPCVLSLTGGNANGKPLASSLHSATRSAGTANITPLTDLIVANLIAQRPAKWLATATPADLSASITEEKLAQALEGLIAALASLPGEPALPAEFHPISSRFVAAPGDAADDLLESYDRALEAADLSHISAVARVAAGEKLAEGVYTATVFTTPDLRSFRMKVTGESRDSKILSIMDPIRGKEHVQWIDSGNRVNGYATSTHAVSHLSLPGMVGGLLEISKMADYSTFLTTDHHQYAYISDDFIEIDPKELFGKSFTVYDNHLSDQKYDTLILDNNGIATIHSHYETYTWHNFLQFFTDSGVTDQDEEEDGGRHFTSHAKAFKSISKQGMVKYAFIRTITHERLEMNESDQEEDSVEFAISE